MRSDHRPANELRDTTIIPNYLIHAEGSVLISAGHTKVICTASIEDRVPAFLRNTGKGWVTAEYGMLPRATSTRMQREASSGKVGGRTQEIQRLIGRSLRSVTKLNELLENQKEKIILIKADEEVEYGAVMATMDQLRQAGLEDIGLVTDPKKSLGGAAGGQ